jgi:hypothetical protein
MLQEAVRRLISSTPAGVILDVESRRVNAGQVIIERIDAMVKIVTVDALFW